MFGFFSPLKDRAAGDAAVKVSATHIKVLAEQWAAMPEEEREALARDTVEELNERRENRQTGIHNVALAAFQDVNRTLAAIEREVCIPSCLM